MDSLENRLIQYIGEAKPTFVFFRNPNCPRCAEMTPVIENAAREIGDKANFITVDTEKYPDIVKAYKVDSHPYYIIFKDGTEAWRDGGRKPFGEIVDMVRRFI